MPYTYLWSPKLIPKPADWGPEIDVRGFVFLDLASSFKPPESLTEFLDAGEPPVYIGFGSIVLDDPDKFTSLIFEAVTKAGVRALVSKGWGGLGDEENTPENVYMLENTPHDWLFPRVSAVIHHGGAGTTAIGLKCGKPTMIVPFFGDQPFWGAMVAKAGAGAQAPIPYKKLTVENFAESIKQCLLPESKAAAKELAKSIAVEGDGASNAVDSFHRHLPMKGEHSMRCSVLQDRVAVWKVKKNASLRLSALAAEILLEKRKIKSQELRLIRHREWDDLKGPCEPITGGGFALLNSVSGIIKGVGSVPIGWAKGIRKKESRSRRSHPSSKERLTSQSGEPKAIPEPEDHVSLERSVEHSNNGGHPNVTEGSFPRIGNVAGNKGLNPRNNAESADDDADGLVQSRLQKHPSDNKSMHSDDDIAQNGIKRKENGLVSSGEALAKGTYISASLAIFRKN